MIQMRSILDIADNTGARRASMIGKIGHPSRYAHVGDIITINIKESSTDATVKKGRSSRPSSYGRGLRCVAPMAAISVLTVTRWLLSGKMAIPRGPAFSARLLASSAPRIT